MQKVYLLISLFCFVGFTQNVQAQLPQEAQIPQKIYQQCVIGEIPQAISSETYASESLQALQHMKEIGIVDPNCLLSIINQYGGMQKTKLIMGLENLVNNKDSYAPEIYAYYLKEYLSSVKILLKKQAPTPTNSMNEFKHTENGAQAD